MGISDVHFTSNSIDLFRWEGEKEGRERERESAFHDQRDLRVVRGVGETGKSVTHGTAAVINDGEISVVKASKRDSEKQGKMRNSQGKKEKGKRRLISAAKTIS